MAISTQCMLFTFLCAAVLWGCPNSHATTFQSHAHKEIFQEGRFVFGGFHIDSQDLVVSYLYTKPIPYGQLFLMKINLSDGLVSDVSTEKSVTVDYIDSSHSVYYDPRTSDLVPSIASLSLEYVRPDDLCLDDEIMMGAGKDRPIYIVSVTSKNGTIHYESRRVAQTNIPVDRLFLGKISGHYNLVYAAKVKNGSSITVDSTLLKINEKGDVESRQVFSNMRLIGMNSAQIIALPSNENAICILDIDKPTQKRTLSFDTKSIDLSKIRYIVMSADYKYLLAFFDTQVVCIDIESEIVKYVVPVEQELKHHLE